MSRGQTVCLVAEVPLGGQVDPLVDSLREDLFKVDLLGNSGANVALKVADDEAVIDRVIPARFAEPLSELVEVASEWHVALLEVLDLVLGNGFPVGEAIEPLLDAPHELSPILEGEVVGALLGRFGGLACARVEVEVEVVITGIGFDIPQVVVLPGEGVS